jgi:hypothetical protein
MNDELPSELATPRQDTSPMDGTVNVPTATTGVVGYTKLAPKTIRGIIDGTP